MPFADMLSSDPTRHQSGYSNPNYEPPAPPELGAHSWLAPHERSQYFEANPKQAFNAFSPQFGTGQKRRGIMSGLGDIMDTYLGDLGRTIMAGDQAPAGGFGDYLAGTRGYEKPFDFDQYYYNKYPGCDRAA